MNAGTRTVMALLFAAVAWPASTVAQTVEEFYRNKSITMLVGGGAGGGYDTYARVFARHLSRHIPGNPNIIAKNMPAAAGLAAASTPQLEIEPLTAGEIETLLALAYGTPKAIVQKAAALVEPSGRAP
jgi:tripartite-type tricarboxylate transporter receptor subunit TctC